MTERPITFPKISEGFYRNAETGVHAFKVTGGYLPCTENRYGTSVPITDGPCATLKQARGVMARQAARVRDEIGTVYTEGVAEHIERAERGALTANASTSRADAARRELQAGNLTMALVQVGLMEAFTADMVRAEARAEDAERLVAKDGEDALIHYWTGYTDVPSACGVGIATTPYTFGSPEWSEVTCKPCEATRKDREALTGYGAALDATRTDDDAEIRENDHVEALAEHHRRYGFSVGDAVVLADPDDTGIDTDAVWHVSAVHAVGTTRAYADLTGFSYPEMRSAAYFDRLAPAPRCTSAWPGRHEFDPNISPVGPLVRCGELRTAEVHNTDRERAARTIYAARDHGGAAIGTPYSGEWPGTTVIRGTGNGKSEMTDLGICRCKLAGGRVHLRTDCADPATPSAPGDLHDDAAWADYAAALPAPTPEAMAEVAVEHSTWTAQRRAAVEAFRTTARTIWTLRAEGLALPGSPAYTSLRLSMQTFRQVINACDQQNDALRRELLTTGSL